MELRGYRRANKPPSGLFSRHYYTHSFDVCPQSVPSRCASLAGLSTMYGGDMSPPYIVSIFLFTPLLAYFRWKFHTLLSDRSIKRGARLPQFGHSGSQVTPTRLMSIRDNNFVNLIFYYIFQQYIPANDD